jgi:hypothetical protein
MTDPAERLKDMDLEGIDVTVNFPGGAGEEWAMLDRDFAIALCRTMNNAKPTSPSTSRNASRRWRSCR